MKIDHQAKSPVFDLSPSDWTRSARPVADVVTLPPECYTSQEFFEQVERPAIFDREWLCVGRTERVPNPGDYYTITVVDEPLVVTRDHKDGEIHVLSAVCQHRGHLVVEGAGSCRIFQCPLHHWTYGTDGELRSAPTMSETPGFDRAKYALPRLRVEIWQGFIFVNFDEDAAPLAPRLTTLENHYKEL